MWNGNGLKVKNTYRHYNNEVRGDMYVRRNSTDDWPLRSALGFVELIHRACALAHL